MRAILVYALLRAALFVAPFALLVAAQVQWYVALVIALLFAFAASYVFLPRRKAAAVAEITRMRSGRTGRDDRADEDVEDETLDGTATDASEERREVTTRQASAEREARDTAPQRDADSDAVEERRE